MWNFNFICRESKQDRNGLAPVELSIIIDGKRTYVALPMKINATDFKKKMASKKNNEVLEYTSAIRLKLNQYINEMLLKDIAITAQSIKDYFKTGGVQTYTLSKLRKDFIAYYNNKSKANAVTSNVVRKYELALDKFQAFMKKDVEIATIKSLDLENFKTYLQLQTKGVNSEEEKAERKFEDTTIAHILIKIKTVFTYAVNNGNLKLNPFNQVTIEKNTKEVVKLDNAEIEVIKHKKFIGRLDKVRDLFLFQCYTGLAYCDMANLVQSDIQFADGMHYIRKARQKTKVVFFTVINDDAMKLLEKYNYQLPVLSNQKYNSYLKEIGDICQINKELHSHIARHTCATRLLNDGMPLEVVAKVLGHTNTRQTQHYAKLLDKTVLNEFRKIS
jgi:site-specific recombinase XerD